MDRMNDHRFYDPAVRMFFMLVAQKHILGIGRRCGMKRDDVPITVRSRRPFGAASAQPYPCSAGRHYLVDEAKNFFFGLRRDHGLRPVCAVLRAARCVFPPGHTLHARRRERTGVGLFGCPVWREARAVCI
jgi:hypothetical protein